VDLALPVRGVHGAVPPPGLAGGRRDGARRRRFSRGRLTKGRDMGPKSSTASVDRLIGPFIDEALSEPAEQAASERKVASCSESVARPTIEFFDDGTGGPTGEGP